MNFDWIKSYFLKIILSINHIYRVSSIHSFDLCHPVDSTVHTPYFLFINFCKNREIKKKQFCLSFCLLAFSSVIYFYSIVQEGIGCSQQHPALVSSWLSVKSGFENWLCWHHCPLSDIVHVGYFWSSSSSFPSTFPWTIVFVVLIFVFLFTYIWPKYVNFLLTMIPCSSLPLSSSLSISEFFLFFFLFIYFFF